MLKKETRNDLDWIVDHSYRYLNAITDRWGNPYRNKHAIVWTYQGLARCANVLGWITALSQSGNEESAEFALKAAEDYCSALDNLNAWGQETKDPADNPRVMVADDGCLHSFALLWLRPTDGLKEDSAYSADDCIGSFNKDYPHRQPKRYGATFNGGLIYHGPGQGETFNVSLSSRMWSVNT